MTGLVCEVDSVLSQFGADAWLDRYWGFLSEENQKVNLVSRETDSLRFRRLVAEALLPFTQLPGKFDSYLDIGSGGGIPSIPLILSGIVSGDSTLYERTIKKAAALTRILRNLGLERVKVVPESFGERNPGRFFSLVTLSYVTLTPGLYESVRTHLARGGKFVYYSRTELRPRDLKLQSFNYAHSGSDVCRSFSVFSK